VAPNARTYVAPPVAAPSPFGLLSAVDLRPDDVPFWRLGVTWQDTCPTGSSTLEPCYPSAPAVTGTSFSKSANATRTNWGATPFTVYAEVDCSAPAFWDDREAYVRTAFERVEQWQLERIFWTGTVGGVANGALPHLAAATAVQETGLGYTTTLQLQSSAVTGVALSPPVALGAVEDALADCLLGVAGVIHIPNSVAPIFAASGLLVKDGPRLRTHNGNLVAVGNGYPRSGPDGADPGLGHSWIFGTGPIFAYRENTIRVLADNNSSLVRTNNTVKVMAERTYLLGYDCCLVGALVSPSSIVTQVSA
jgi:hypothetical protein